MRNTQTLLHLGPAKLLSYELSRYNTTGLCESIWRNGGGCPVADYTITWRDPENGQDLDGCVLAMPHRTRAHQLEAN